MTSPATGCGQTDNHLLAALTPADFNLIKPSLVDIDLVRGEALIKPNMPINAVYFPERGMVSLVQPLTDGTLVEVGVVGREGMVGSTILSGVDRAPVEAMVQMAGTALRLPAKVLLEVASANARVQQSLLRFGQALFVHVSQSAACNARHRIEQRLARWLLVARDRADSNEMQLSHEFLAIMLGNRRAGVTVGLAKFRERGLIQNGHGIITITNRRGLELASCECYRAVRDETKRLLA